MFQKCILHSRTFVLECSYVTLVLDSSGRKIFFENSQNLFVQLEQTSFMLYERKIYYNGQASQHNYKKGFPLDSLSIHIKTNKYYYDLPTEALEEVAVEDGFLEFFKRVIG